MEDSSVKAMQTQKVLAWTSVEVELADMVVAPDTSEMVFTEMQTIMTIKYWRDFFTFMQNLFIFSIIDYW